jgi:hypothetical protein
MTQKQTPSRVVAVAVVPSLLLTANDSEMAADAFPVEPLGK